MTKVRDSFDDCYIPEPNSGCWLWLRGLSGGYGKVCFPVKHEIGAHVVSFERSIRKLSPVESVLHRCDNPSCVNPEHLYAGTTKDNAIDMARRGRQHVQKLSLADIAAIKTDTRTQKGIAKDYGVTQSQISLIKTGKRWAHDKSL